MYIIQDVHSFYNFFYFVILIIVSKFKKNGSYFILNQIGTFFMINLCLVVIANQFSETRRRETAKMKQEREEFSSDSSLSSFSDRSVTNDARASVVNGQLYCSETEDTNLYRDIINLVHYYIRRLYHRSRKFRRVSLISSSNRHDCFCFF